MQVVIGSPKCSATQNVLIEAKINEVDTKFPDSCNGISVVTIIGNKKCKFCEGPCMALLSKISRDDSFPNCMSPSDPTKEVSIKDIADNIASACDDCSSSHKLSKGTIVGIILGSAVGLAVVGYVGYRAWKRRKMKNGITVENAYDGTEIYPQPILVTPELVDPSMYNGIQSPKKPLRQSSHFIDE